MQGTWGGGRGGGGQSECDMAQSHTNTNGPPTMPNPTATTSHNAHSHRTCSHAQAMARTVGSGGSRGVRRSGRAPGANRPHKPTAHTYLHNTEQHHVAHLRGPRVARGRPLQADMLPRAANTIHYCMHTPEVGGGGREQGERAGGGGQGTRCECGLTYTQHTNGVTQCSTLQPPLPAPHTATSFAVTHRRQLAPGTGRGQGRGAPWTCNRPPRTQHHGAHLRGPRMARGRPLQADLLPRALCTIHCWVHTQLESAGRQRGTGRGGGGQPGRL
jgi:hypothetical protein